MTQTQQPDALRIADLLEQCSHNSLLSPLMEVANELRSQHARIAELESQLAAIGAIGVEPLRKQAAVPQGWKLVQIELLERIQESLGSYLSDHGWSQSDMDAADALDGLLAAAPQPPACNQSMQPELATYSAQARKEKGIEQ